MLQFNLNFIPAEPGIYIVGGTVRDLLIGRRPQDYDIAVFGAPGAVAERIARAAGGRPVRIGKGENTIYRVVAPAHTFDISAGRGESIADDLELRDFTVNAMAFGTAEKRLIDPLNGCRDLKNGIIRMVSPDAFASDPLRLLRAFRMAAGLGFSIHAVTLSNISSLASTITDAAGERIREEWLKLIANPSSAVLEQMDATGLLCAIFPELLPTKGCDQNGFHCFDVFRHSLAVFRKTEQLIEENRPALLPGRSNSELIRDKAAHSLIKHAALLHDIGKPAVRTLDSRQTVHFRGHEKTGAEMAAGISDRLRMSNREKGYVDALIRHHLQPLSLYLLHTREESARKAIARFFFKHKELSPDLLLLSTADMLGKGVDRHVSDYLDFVRELFDSYFYEYKKAATFPPLISGRDLMEHFGLMPSPLFARILAGIEIERLSGRIRTRDEALAEVKKILDFQNRS